MKILTLDIENAPNLAYVWGLFKQNISLAQIEETGSVIAFAAKWHGKSKVHFHSDFHDGHEGMLEAAHALISEADVIVHYNGTSFDMPHLNREFLLAGMPPPAPYQQVDLLRHVRKHFKFTSNKLDYVCQSLGLGEKTSHSGFQLWVDCMAGDEKAWNLMKKYNKQDVVITEKLYDKLATWINAPSISLYIDESDCCTACGSTDLQSRGYAYTAVSVYKRYQCQSCGKWLRGKSAEKSTTLRSA